MLNTELAQRIVNSVIPIINCNVNVFDKQGVIIGSGDKERIGQVHAIAKEIISSPAYAKSYGIIQEAKIINGTMVHPGVNLPIYLNNEVIGAIGVTGNPSQVLNYARLIQQTAELLVWKEITSNSIELKRMLSYEFVTAILEHKDLSSGLTSSIKNLQIDYENFHYCTLIELESNQNIINEIDAIFKFLPKAAIGKDDRYIIVFTNRKVDFNKLKSGSAGNFNFYTGCRVDNWMDLDKSLTVAKAKALFHKEAPSSRYKESNGALAVIINYLENPYLYLPDLKKYSRMAQKKNLLETHEAYIHFNGAIKEICEKLDIHRNTIIYRLQRIKEITGLDVRKSEDSFRLFSLHIIYQVMDKEEKNALLKGKTNKKVGDQND
ncbi:hypothetical protein GX831_03735 [bacterium]|nr:hypothetical protein [bacterium]